MKNVDPKLYIEVQQAMYRVDSIKRKAEAYDADFKALRALHFDYECSDEAFVELRANLDENINLLQGICFHITPRTPEGVLIFSEIFERAIIEHGWKFKAADVWGERRVLTYTLTKECSTSESWYDRKLWLYVRLHSSNDSCQWVQTGVKSEPVFEFRCYED